MSHAGSLRFATAVAGRPGAREAPRGNPGFHRHRLEPEAWLPDRFETLLARLRSDGEEGERGSLQILSLEPTKARLGPRWPTLAARIQATAACCLERGLGEQDAYVPLGDDLVLLLFGRLDREQAATRARLIAAEITARLFGANPGGTCIAVRPGPPSIAAALEGVASASELRARLSEADQPRETPAQAVFRRLEPRLRLRFFPVVNLRKALVSVYGASPVTVDGEGVEAMLEAGRGDIEPPALRAELDLWTLRRAVAMLPALVGRGRKAPMLVPVHYETVASMAPRRPYLALCRRLPDLSSRRLVFELQGMPPALPRTRVREVMGYLKPFAAGVVVDLGLEPQQLERFATTGLVGLALRAAQLGTQGNVEVVLRALAEVGRRHGLATFLLELDRPTLGRVALDAGISHLSGPALLDAVERPGRVHRLPRV